MNLVQFNEAYREMLESNQYAILPFLTIRLSDKTTSTVRLVRTASKTPHEFCPITAIARFKLNESFFLNDYSDAATSLSIPADLMNCIVEISDHAEIGFSEYIYTATNNSLFAFVHEASD